MRKPSAKLRARRAADSVLSHLSLAVLSAVWLIPILWVVLTSFRQEPGMLTPTFFPKNYTVDNFVKLFTEETVAVKFVSWYKNTLLLAAANCVLSTLITIGTAYSLARFRFRMRKPFMNIALILGMFPGFMAMIAVFLVLNVLGLIGNPIALLVVYVSGAGLGFYVSKGYFETISISIDEAAMIDGASRLTIFLRIILPLSKPIIIYTAITAFMSPWMDFILASMILNDPEFQTVAVGLYNLITDPAGMSRNFTLFAAGCVATTVPIVVVYMLLQRFMVKGIAAGAGK